MAVVVLLMFFGLLGYTVACPKVELFSSVCEIKTSQIPTKKREGN